MYQDNKYRRGFTLVELMLAMGFVSALLLAIAMTVMQISTIFNRGLAMKAVDQVSSTISSGLQTDINNTSPFSLTAVGEAARYYNKTGVGGRLCLNGYTYIWNYGNAINDSSLKLQANTYSDSSQTLVKFAKISDPTNQYCKDASIKGGFSNSLIDKSSAAELLDAGQYNLAIHNVSIISTSEGTDTKTNQQLYSIKITLGTNVAKTIDTAAGKCYLPNVSNANAYYDPMCYISDFSIVVRAGNKVQ